MQKKVKNYRKKNWDKELDALNRSRKKQQIDSYIRMTKIDKMTVKLVNYSESYKNESKRYTMLFKIK